MLTVLPKSDKIPSSTRALASTACVINLSFSFCNSNSSIAITISNYDSRLFMVRHATLTSRNTRVSRHTCISNLLASLRAVCFANPRNHGAGFATVGKMRSDHLPHNSSRKKKSTTTKSRSKKCWSTWYQITTRSKVSSNNVWLVAWLVSCWRAAAMLCCDNYDSIRSLKLSYASYIMQVCNESKQ